MKPSVYTYPDPKHFTVFYRGFVKRYDKNKVTTISCPNVHKNKWRALDDAKKMIKKLSTDTGDVAN